jgi:hypothetical protein
MRDKLTNALFYISAIALVFLVVLAFRYFTNYSTPIVISHPEVGITCASMTTGDGVAVSCWKG